MCTSFPCTFSRTISGFAASTPAQFPVARDVSARIISLPLYPKMTVTDVGDVAAAVTKLATAYHR
ncbi:DegT/DnrJ/EryC1/StrS family aminotransferase [Nocardia puris]|uniref:DegT/DnrJ/EryC1/StrS family aminotransferase n=1 Tax=Nocardia puris TaxID=208602 RepID=UPI00398927E5